METYVIVTTVMVIYVIVTTVMVTYANAVFVPMPTVTKVSIPYFLGVSQLYKRILTQAVDKEVNGNYICHHFIYSPPPLS